MFEPSDSVKLEENVSATWSVMRQLFDSADHPVYLKDSHKKVVYVNPVLLSLMDSPLHEVIGHPVESFFPDQQVRHFEEIEINVIETGEPRHFDSQLVFPNGEYVVHRVYIKRVYIEGAAYALGYGFSITDVIIKDALMNEKMAELAMQTRYHSLSEQTSLISHQVNQPLSAINIYTEGALRLCLELPDNCHIKEKLRHAVESIGKQANQVARVIKSFRSLYQRNEQMQEQVDVNELVVVSKSLIQSLADKESVVVNTNLLRALPLVLVDKVQLQQVLLNLVQNAIEAHAVDRKQSTKEKVRWILVSTELSQSGGVRIIVKDNGPGLSKDDARQVFDMYFSSKPNNVGLGLSICQTFVERNGGRIYLNEEYDEGCEFVIELE